MPNTPHDTPLDLELLRVGLHMDETHAVARYTLSGRGGNFFCLVRDADDIDRMNLTEAINRTHGALLAHNGDANYQYDVLEGMMGVVYTDGLEEIDPITYAAHEWTALGEEEYSLDGHVTSVVTFPASELNDRSPLSEQQRRNVQMAFDSLDPELCLGAARLLAAHELDSWSAYEVCSATMDHLPDEMVASLAEDGRDHRQVRELRRIAERVIETEPGEDGTLHRAFSELADRRDLPANHLRTARRVIGQTGHQFDLAWLRLDQRQLDEVSFALSSGVPLPVVRLYSIGALGEFAPSAMFAITTGYLEGVQSEDFARMVNPAYDVKQLWEVEAACVAHTGGVLSTDALDLICDPALPQPVMNALRLGFTHYDLSVDAARDLITPDVTAEQVWGLIEAKDAPDGALEAEVVSEVTAPEQPQQGTLRDTERSQRVASSQLTADEGHETREHAHEEKE